MAIDPKRESRTKPAPIRTPRIPQEWGGQPIFLYAIQTGNFIKVGLSKNINQRVREMELLNPLEPNLVLYRRLTQNIGVAVERRAHELLAAFHHRREWFHAMPIEDLRKAVKTAVREGEALDRLENKMEAQRQQIVRRLQAENFDSEREFSRAVRNELRALSNS